MTTKNDPREKNVQKLKKWREAKISELGKEEYDRRNKVITKESRQRQIKNLGKEEFDRRVRESSRNSRERRLRMLGKEEYNRVLRDRALVLRKKKSLKLGTELFLSKNPNTNLPKEEELISIGNAERLRLNRIKDKKKRDAAQARGIETLGADEYWRRLYAKRKKERKSNPVMDEARKARLRTPAKRAQYAAYYKKKRLKIGFRIGGNIRRRVSGALMCMFGKTKDKDSHQKSSIDVFGCSIDHLMFHFKQLFVEGMNFSNYGNGAGEWNVDHILCIAYFKKELENGTPEEVKKI